MSATIMVVDDSPSMRQLVSFTLEDSGYAVLTAGNGREALDTLTASPNVSMVITDLNMPEMDGIELIRKLREQSSYRFKPIVMLTTESQEVRKNEGKTAGASGWLVKPFTPEKLLGVIKQLMK